MFSSQDQLFKALADPTRRALFVRLCTEGDKTVAALTEKAGVSQPVVSKHLRVLKEAGLVSNRPDGRQTHYSARPDALVPLTDWARDMTRFWHTRLNDLENLLDRMDQ